MAVLVESLDQEGRGVAHDHGKAIFIEGALPGEWVTYSAFRRKPKYELAEATDILRESFMRVKPRCPHFGVCGGCNMQHFEFSAQVAAKQRILEDDLERIGKVRADSLLPPIYGPAWGYRHRARFSVRYVAKKGRALVGFHEKHSSFVALIGSCEVLAPKVSRMLPALAELVSGLSIRDRLPQIELAQGDAVTILVVRILQPLNAEDEQRLKRFAEAQGIQFWLQPQGPDSASPFWPIEAPELYYSLPEFNIKIHFSPTEFTQVNPAINRVLVQRTMALLDPEPGERIADLFCGVGNFSLAIARRGADVVGVEGEDKLVARAEENARRNRIMAEFVRADLYSTQTAATLTALGKLDKVLVDPPRDGAIEVVKSLGDDRPRRIVYVSCNPATLARDAAVLVHTKGYRFSQAGVINMFPHTGHVESIAVFDQ